MSSLNVSDLIVQRTSTSFVRLVKMSIVALGMTVLFTAGTSLFAQEQTTTAANQLARNTTAESVESFVSADVLAQNAVNFTPARVDMITIKKNVRYPEVALRDKITGKFDLIVYVASNGDVSAVNFITERPNDDSMNAIIASACDAVKKSQFAPATLNNKAINSTVRIPFNFTM
jgi:TonB family protein